MTIRYSGMDVIEAIYVERYEDSFGGIPSAQTGHRWVYPQEIVPDYDPDLKLIYILRSDSYARSAKRILSGKPILRCRLSWMQAVPVSPTTYWQTNLLKAALGDNPISSLWMEVLIKRSDTNKFWLRLNSLKAHVVTIRGSIGEPQQWTAEFLGYSMSTATSALLTAPAEHINDPWEWEDTYIQYSTNGTDFYDFPDVTDYEIKLYNSFKPNYIFRSTGSKQLTSLEPGVERATARLTANLTDKTFIDYLVNLSRVDLKLLMPENKWVLMSRGQFRRVPVNIKTEDLIALTFDYESMEWTHGF